MLREYAGALREIDPKCISSRVSESQIYEVCKFMTVEASTRFQDQQASYGLVMVDSKWQVLAIHMQNIEGEQPLIAGVVQRDAGPLCSHKVPAGELNAHGSQVV